jgi:DNA-binding GntR family transcriptional regulator
MPARICKNILREDIETKSLNLLLRERCGIQLSRSDVWIEAPLISKREQKILGDPKVPLFLAIVGITFDQDGRPIRYSRGVFRGDRVRMKISDIGLCELDYAHLLV